VRCVRQTAPNQLQPGETALTIRQRVCGALAGFSIAYVAPFATCIWWLTLKTASALVTSDVNETRMLIDNTSATSDKWDRAVVPKVLYGSLLLIP